MDNSFRLGPSEPLMVPVKHPGDVERIGSLATDLATAFDVPVELVSIVSPDDDEAEQARRLAEALADLGVAHASSSRVVVADRAAEAFVDLCCHRVVCMASAASPFKSGHYVGSFAASLLAHSTQPVLLLGPAASGRLESFGEVVAAVSDDAASMSILPFARELAMRLELPVSTVHVETATGNIYTNDYGEPRLWFPDSVHASVGVEPLAGDAVAGTLLDRSAGAIVAVATSARQGLAWIADGSVAFDVVAETDGPVLVVGPNAGAVSGGPPRF